MADNNPKIPTPSSSSRTTMVMVIILLAVAFFVGSQFMRTGAAGATVTDQLITSEFTQAVEQGRVKSVTYSAGDYTVSGAYFPAVTAGAEAAEAFNGAFDAMNALVSTEKNPEGKTLAGVGTTTLEPATLGKEHNYTSTYVGSDSLGELLAAHPDVSYQVTLPSPFLEIFATLLPILIIGGLLFFFFFKMQQANNSQMNFGKAKTKKAAEERPDVKFSDVAGVDEAVEEMQEIKDFLANPAKYQSMGAKIPRGCLLVGPPGTGKTLLARAVAGEAGVPFFSISGSDFVEMFVGVGASRVRDLFQQAKDAAPAIIFIDEIDAVGRQRGTGLGGGHDEREQTLNQLLVEMDGFESNDSVVLIAATNRADVLDPALLRPGRFDRQIVVDTPDVRGREKILTVHAKDKPIGSDVDLSKIAKITPGFTGADLANLMNESALLTARRGKKIITMREVSESMERVIAGPERKGRVMNEKTKHTIAYHESGHALVGHLLDHADPVHKISIISRGRALGYTLSIPDEDKVLNSLSEMKDELAVFMGGRVAEEIFCDDVTTGASNDLERASKMARAIVTQYGMSPLGTQVFGQPNHEVFLGRDYGNTQDYSEETARRIDEEVAKIMKEAHDRAHKILADHADQMDLMASVLLERETVEGEACEALLDNKWDEYLAREDEIIAAKEAEEAAARAKDAELLAAQGNAEGAQTDAAGTSDAGETLADPHWREAPVEPGDQDPNAPYRKAAEDADRADMPDQAEVNAAIDREDAADSTADAPDPNKKGE
jgi:cell division protease FtsH|nr:ATP-dependent zinc metalloprotease FtsH [Adlercreutzia caecimuris]